MLQNCNTLKVASVFFLEPTKEHYLKQISKKSNLAHTSVKKILEDLEKEGIIKEKKYQRGSRNFPFYFANTENNKYKQNKKIFNLDKIYSLGIIEFLKTEIMPENIVLFGSYLKAEDTEDSDVDLFVQAKTESLSEKTLRKFEKKLGRNIQLHFKEKFQDYNAEIKNNILNGLVLYGYLEPFTSN